MIKFELNSREIAELTGKRHNHVLRDIRVVIEQANELSVDIKNCYEIVYDNSSPYYILDERMTLLTIGKYSMTHRIVILDYIDLIKNA